MYEGGFEAFYENTFYFINKSVEIKKLVITFLLNHLFKFISHLNTKTMSKYFKLRNIPFLLFVVFLISSCGNDDTTVTNTNAPASTSTPVSTDAQAATSTANKVPPEGTLNKIWIDASKFNDQNWQNSRMVFSFAIDQGYLTLYGWACKGNGPGGVCNGQYDHDPNLKLEQGQSTTVPYGPVVFWDNLILEQKNVKDIQKKIVDSNFLYVVFKPQNTNGHINYRVILTKNHPKTLATGGEEDTMIDANPSPPKNSSN